MDEERERSWSGLERELQALTACGECSKVILLVDQFISKGQPAEIACQALIWRGDAKESAGDIPGALADLSEAHALSARGSYRRYVLECTIGSLLKATGDPKKAIEWFHRALESVIDAKDIAGGNALRNFVELKGEVHLDSEERRFCVAAAIASWRALGQPGEPDLTSLATLAKTLTSLGSRSIQK